jgi:hypothetical protein
MKKSTKKSKKEKVMYITTISYFSERNNPNITNFLIDDSFSMSKIRRAGFLEKAVTEIMIPALEGAAEDHQELLRISLGAFSDGKIQSLTKNPGFFSLKELKKKQIIAQILGGPGLNGGTALYRSIISGIQSCKAAAEIVRGDLNCRKVTLNVVCLTDGANNDRTTSTKDVANEIRNTPGYMDLNVSLAYFKTNEAITRAQFIHIAQECGLTKNDCHFFADHGDSMDDQKLAFRTLMGTLSTRRMRKG